MLLGDKVLLRARIDSDVAVLHAELYDDVWTRARTDTRVWRPISPGSPLSPFAMSDPSEEFVAFSVVERTEEHPLAGAAVLHMIDNYNRSAHIGISLRPAFRGRGLAVDTVRVLCEYGFTVRGLHRLAIETLSDNEAMFRTAEHAGFVREGVLRKAAWVTGEFVDEVLFGMLVDEWPGRDAIRETSEELVDEAGRESFPASDPPAF
ncbi:MAG: GNAT family protein [Acidimicrobiales bacterium]|jgi:RimJ/RimL family protein N-acetyltransferase